MSSAYVLMCVLFRKTLCYQNTKIGGQSVGLTAFDEGQDDPKRQ